MQLPLFFLFIYLLDTFNFNFELQTNFHYLADVVFSPIFSLAIQLEEIGLIFLLRLVFTPLRLR